MNVKEREDELIEADIKEREEHQSKTKDLKLEEAYDEDK